MKIFTILLRLFAIIGLISLVVHGYHAASSLREAKIFTKNCKMVKPGMTLSKAKMIMGDYDWFDKTSPSIIWLDSISDKNKVLFYLDYPSELLGSEGPRIFFDPVTMTVTELNCGY